MEDKILPPLLLGLAVIAVVTVGATAWRCALRLQRQPEDVGVYAAGATWFRLVGWFLIWTGALSLFATSVGITANALDAHGTITLAPAAVVVAIAALVTLIVAIRATTGVRSSLIREESQPASGEPVEPSSLSKFLAGVATPLGLQSACAVATGVLVVLFEAGVLSLGFSAPNEQVSVFVLLIALLAEIATLTGLLLAMGAELLTLPLELVDDSRRSFLSRLLWTLGAVTGVLAIAPLVAMGLVAAAFLAGGLMLFPIMAVSTVGGRRRASELAACWTLLHAVKSRQPLERELAAQADASNGRTRKLLTLASQDLESGTPLDEVAFQRHLVPRSAWLEVRAGMSTRHLREALQAAAAREIERFSHMSSPGTPRLSAAYFGIVWGALIQIVAFVMYYIVPKYKKIFEDFDTELPTVLTSLIHFSDFMVYSMLWLVGIGMVVAAFAIELLVDYYGWDGMLERFGSRFRVRFATPDLLRGVKWAVVAGRPLDGVLQDMAATPVTFLVKNALHRSAAAIREGEDAWTALQQAGWIRAEEAELLRCAQAAGNLPWALDALSQSIGLRRGFRLEWWLQVLHPVMVLSAAVLVGWFALAMFLPIVKLVNDFS